MLCRMTWLANLRPVRTHRNTVRTSQLAGPPLSALVFGFDPNDWMREKRPIYGGTLRGPLRGLENGYEGGMESRRG